MADSLERKCAAPTTEQITVAQALGAALRQDTPALVAAAELRVLLRTPLGLTLAGDFDDEEYEVLLDLASRTGLAVPDMEQIEYRELLNAWLHVARDCESAAALRRLKPAVDDVVTARDRRKGPDLYGEISSVGANGRLYFRGGHGLGTAPHRITRIVRPDEDGYADQLRLAREYVAAAQSNPTRITRAQEVQLAQWRVSFPATPAAVEALRNALETADDEATMQRLLEKHPALLASTVVGTHDTWVRPQVQLGNHYMADFMIAGQTSLGIRWTLVELESPVSRMSNPGNKRASTTLRHAVDQIEDWRRWLSANLHYARSARNADGLGLPGITAEVPGLIIMAREDADDAAADIRELHARRSHIQVRTYDWLMRINESPDPLRRDAPEQRDRLA
ncbi:Shedu anti-phage system protein SduA domain-containing protein [Streptomyces zaomyceticus]|uniref:Shedu anti-phage system protein SduA domain-containing protein n=1 Tax=Streptomyces zaomyceticus TaxID=68286 RepID=UPI0016773DF2|nr:Shedu anti-phage system protein SduA domain-containing protein [Streptomyces zaomyceticus]